MRINQKGEGEFIHPYTSLSLWLSNGKKNTQHWFVQSSTTYDFIVYFALQREAMDTTTLTQSLFSGWEFSSTPATKPSFAAAPVCSWRTAKGNKRKQKKIGGGARGTHLDFRHIYPTSNYYFIYWKNNRRLLLSPPSLPPSLQSHTPWRACRWRSHRPRRSKGTLPRAVSWTAKGQRTRPRASRRRREPGCGSARWSCCWISTSDRLDLRADAARPPEINAPKKRDTFATSICTNNSYYT